MDGERDDPLDDDVTVVGDHELVLELRRIAAERAPGTGTPLPPPRPSVAAVGPGAPAPGADRPSGRPTTRRDVPPQPRALVGQEWWDDDEDADGPGRMRLVLVIVLVAALAAAAVLLLR